MAAVFRFHPKTRNESLAIHELNPARKK